MRAIQWTAAAGLLLAFGTAHAGPGLPIGHDDTEYPDDLIEAAPARRVDVAITDRGPQPRTVHVDGGEKLDLVLTRLSANACRSDVLVDGYDLRTSVPSDRPVTLSLVTHGRGDLRLTCPMEDVVAVDPQ